MQLQWRARGLGPAVILSLMGLHPGPVKAQDSDSHYRPAPWLSLGVELRSRTEADTAVDFDSQHQHLFTLSRWRLETRIQAPSWLRFHITLQDARTLAGKDPDLVDQNSNQLDFLNAYIEAAPDDGRVWRLRVGRQALAFGSEDLIGPMTSGAIAGSASMR
ncbi:MAG TPA: porin [Bryobacteraceae bacterium]|nr:porin [Bryobacteraceae bacterium]